VEDLDAWLADNWDPDLTVGAWWELLGNAGWATPTWPTAWFGRGLTDTEALEAHRRIAAHGALGPPGGIGVLLAGPTILTHGTEEQKRRLLPDIVTGRASWCQLFSEPVAGSDLAGLQTRAEVDGDGWVVNGQKVWTSTAHVADLGLLIARTDADAPKHRGITYFTLDMHQLGVDIRPLRELTGRSLFNEVFLTDVRVGSDDVVGGLGNGWAVTNTTLAYERSGLGAGGANTSESVATPGSVAGDLVRRAGDLVRPSGGSATFAVRASTLVEAARRHGRLADPMVRDGIIRHHIEGELGRFMSWRRKGLVRSGRDLPGSANMAKLRMSELFRQSRDAGLAILGARGMLHDYAGGAPVVDDHGVDRALTALALWSPSASIYGGSDEIQRNILGERVLGLPREPGDDRTTPFRELRRNV
jgi:alkylation response protein AidB-like acyl-CoA dehydrogenase